MAHETRRLVEAACALHILLRAASVPHAFYGSFIVSLLSNSPCCDEIFCVVEGSNCHPYGRVRQACAGNENITVRSSPWSNRMHATYHRLIPSIDIEILPSGETGPRRLDGSTVMILADLPVLTLSEFLRAKLNNWVIRRTDKDAEDITYTLTHHWNRIDINRILEQDMHEFVKYHKAVVPAWVELRKKYGL